MPHYRIVFFTHSFILTTEMPLPKFLGKLLREKSTSIAFSRVHDEGEKIPNLSHLRRRKYSTLPPPLFETSNIQSLARYLAIGPRNVREEVALLALLCEDP